MVVAGAARSAGVARDLGSARLGRWPARARGAGLVVTAISWPIGQRDVGPEVRSRARGGAAAPPHPLLLTPLLVPLALSDTRSGLLSPPRRVSPPTHRGRLARSSAPPVSLSFAPPFGEFELTRFRPPSPPPLLLARPGAARPHSGAAHPSAGAGGAAGRENEDGSAAHPGAGGHARRGGGPHPVGREGRRPLATWSVTAEASVPSGPLPALAAAR